MRTERQKQAARANGAKSRGPITSEGRLASSRNAVTHGLLSGTIVLKGESEERFHALLADLLTELQPQTSVEITLVENMAVARWRQLRIWGIEKANMEHQMRADASSVDPTSEDNATRCALAFRTLSDDSRSLELINRYESRYDRQYLRAHRRFLELVDRRTPPPILPSHHEPPALTPDKPAPGPQLVPPPENPPQPPGAISAKQTRQPVKRKGRCPEPPQNTGAGHPHGGEDATRFARVTKALMPSNRFAAVACAIILSAISFMPRGAVPKVAPPPRKSGIVKITGTGDRPQARDNRPANGANVAVRRTNSGVAASHRYTHL